MEFLYGAVTLIIVEIILLVIIAIARIYQLSASYKQIIKFKEEKEKTILMLDYYHDSRELKARLDTTARLYKKLSNDFFVAVILTVGKLKYPDGSTVDIAKRNKDDLIALGIPKSSIVIYRPKKGAADTFSEVGLACEWLKENGKHSLILVANIIQLFQAYYICLFQKIYPEVEVVPILDDYPHYAIGKIFQIILLFLTPSGKDPFSSFLKAKRRIL